MTTIPLRPATIVASTPTSPARLNVVAVRAGRAVLDGGWWPRSWDAGAELPGLIAALDDRFGPIRQVLLNLGVWNGRFRRLPVGRRVVRMGWFASQGPALLIATTERGDQLDLLVVPPDATEPAARAAMARAADPADTATASDILAALPTRPGTTAPHGDGGTSTSVWDNEGGHLVQARPHRPVGVVVAASGPGEPVPAR